MLLRHHLVLAGAILPLAFLAGCGSSNKITPPPSGGFSISNLNGTYVFSTTGTDSSGSNAPIMIAGAFTANGSGTITGGSFTFADGTVGVGSNQAISGGSYTVTADGRGQAQLANSSALGQTITLDFALASSDHGLVSEFDGNGSGSGTLDKQGTVAQSDIDGQSFAFSVGGVGSSGPIATLGAFTLDSTGAVSTGLADLTTTNATVTPPVSTSSAGIALTNSSSVTLGTATAPGSAVINPSSPFTFDVYAIDATHLKVIETDGIDFMSGDVFSQQTSLPTGTIAFTMAGLDSGAAPLSMGGLLPVSGANISGGVQDYNDGGTSNSISSVTGSFTALSGGRSLLTLSGIVNGASNQVPGNYTFAAYPSTGGTLLLEIDNAGITSGIALAQTTTSFAGSTGYAMSLSATNTTSEEDDIAEFTATTSGFSGNIDINDQGNTSTHSLTGSYQASSNGRYTLTSNAFIGNFYTVDGTTVLFLETDNNQVGNGVFVVQSTPTSSSAAPAQVVTPRRVLVAGHSLKRRSK